MIVADQLLADCHDLAQGNQCRLLLHKNATLHWLILVPDCGSEFETADLLDLPGSQRELILNQAAEIAAVLKTKLGYPKVNFAAIGNVVPQLHLHLVGRRPGDACWPAPVWGNLAAGPEYTATQINELLTILPPGWKWGKPVE